jgi:hypothetical protein
VDNWELLVDDNFEGTFPITATCAVWDFSTDGFDRKWGKDSLRATSPTYSIWPARDGANGMDPATNNYPTNLDSWLKCGPYSFSNAQRLMVRYTRWLDIPDPDVGDFLFVGASTDGTWFNGVQWWGVGQYWVDEKMWLMAIKINLKSGSHWSFAAMPMPQPGKVCGLTISKSGVTTILPSPAEILIQETKVYTLPHMI